MNNGVAMQSEDPSDEAAVAATRAWVEKAVVGLNLCPFARAVFLDERIRYSVSAASDADALVADLAREINTLMEADPAQSETTLLIHPRVMGDFLDYNDFLDIADATIEALGYTGELQVASFHPQYQFAGTAPEDIENYSNRSPYPTLHLLREESIERAVEAMPDTDAIYENNIETLKRLGPAGWRALWGNGSHK
ncbi:MAG TPA: DUF1415 domain-containing protein [Burkholderiales bacterium]|nr:DUF1415 domain-containing protein [Burkholderiales bacterium]